MIKRLLLVATLVTATSSAAISVKHNATLVDGPTTHIYRCTQNETILLISVEDILAFVKNCHPTEAGYQHMLEQFRKPQFSHSHTGGDHVVGAILGEDNAMVFTGVEVSTYGMNKEAVAVATWLEEMLNRQAFKDRFVTEVKLLKGDALTWDRTKYIVRR